jgi:hypothetical protein
MVDTIDMILHYLRNEGREMTKEEFMALPRQERRQIVKSLLPDEVIDNETDFRDWVVRDTLDQIRHEFTQEAEREIREALERRLKEEGALMDNQYQGPELKQAQMEEFMESRGYSLKRRENPGINYFSGEDGRKAIVRLSPSDWVKPCWFVSFEVDYNFREDVELSIRTEPCLISDTSRFRELEQAVIEARDTLERVRER